MPFIRSKLFKGRSYFFVMLLAYAEEVHHLPVKIVQDLDLGGFLLEKYLGTSRECFHERFVRRERIDDLLCYRALAADVGQGATHGSLFGFLSVVLWRFDFDLY